jgi:hypothetical protein
MKMHELMERISAVLPNASLGEDNDGQIIINTNLRAGKGDFLVDMDEETEEDKNMELSAPVEKVDELQALQDVMDSAYKKWVPDTSYYDFLLSLTPTERAIVVIGNLNYQVENGGFSQWKDNRYNDGAEFLFHALKEVGTPLAKQVEDLVTKYLDSEPDNSSWDEDDSWNEGGDGDGLDSEFYKINSDFMKEVQTRYCKE